MKRLSLVIAIAAAVIGALAPAAARADDAAAAAAVTKWSLRISKPAKDLSTKISSAKTPDEALVFLRSFTRTATQGAAALASQHPDTARGRKLKQLSVTAFSNYAKAGRLLIDVMNGIKAGKGQRELEPKLNRSITLATTGSASLTKAANLIPALIG